MLIFISAAILLVITPGPGVLSTAGIGAAFGMRPAIAYISGLFIGGNLVNLAVISGLAAILLASPVMRYALVVLSTLYLLYLALRIAFAGSKIGFIAVQNPPGIAGGLMLQLFNPKAYVVGTTMFGGFPIEALSPVWEIIAKLVVFNLIWTPIHFGWAFAGVALNRLDLSPRAQRAINIAMALAMLGVVGLAFLADKA